MIKLKYSKISSAVSAPYKSTAGSACYDLYAYLPERLPVQKYITSSASFVDQVQKGMEVMVLGGSIPFKKFDRVMVPTGLFFEIPEGYCVKIYPRSGNSIKKGWGIINSVGIIDSDYRDELKILMVNFGNDSIISMNDKIAQMEVVPTHEIDWQEVESLESAGTERIGGFGSTGN